MPINLSILLGVVFLTFVMLNNHSADGAAVGGYSIDFASKRSTFSELVRDKRIYELIVKKRDILKVFIVIVLEKLVISPFFLQFIIYCS